ncbi:EF-hand domain [Macleaya cordata]|uniref:EF-hand domain n=1 Tax=Macleaya cordata TaxID=56857 RepID=A0A200PXZ6_MACCD|nr:EF-hand domain [Macleaya cordata]
MHSLNTRKARKKLPVQKNTRESDYVDDDEALIQAIALSLGDSSEVSGAALRGPPRNSRADVTDVVHSERKGKGRIKENDGKRKRIKSNTSRVQMSEDQVIIHFFHFDEAGKGNITKKDLQRVATAHDFIWTDKEMADMIHSFDSDGDGKVSVTSFTFAVRFIGIVLLQEEKYQLPVSVQMREHHDHHPCWLVACFQLVVDMELLWIFAVLTRKRHACTLLDTSAGTCT